MGLPLPDRPRILLIRLSAVGDVANCLPAAAALRAHLPLARLAWAVDDRFADLVACAPDVDEILRFPRRGTPAAVAAFLASLREHGFDAAVDLHGNARSGLVAWASRAPIRLGFAHPASREGNAIWTTHRLKVDGALPHRTDRSLALLSLLGVPPAPPRWHLRPPERAARTAAAWLADAGVPEPFVAIHPGASAKGRYKQWAAERFARLADDLIADGHRVVFFRGPGEEETLAAVGRAMTRTLVATPVFALDAALAFLARARLVVGSDSGPVHLAHALGRPTVAIFGPKDPRQYGPRGRFHHAIYRALPCSPCRNTSCPHRRCLDLVSAEEVTAAARDILAVSTA